MADKHHPPSDDHASGGTMDITEHTRMWLAFWNATKWSCVALAVLGLLLLLFRTNDSV
jgi:hypothetical protein